MLGFEDEPALQGQCWALSNKWLQPLELTLQHLDQPWFVSKQEQVFEVCSLEITRDVYCGMNSNDTDFGVE